MTTCFGNRAHDNLTEYRVPFASFVTRIHWHLVQRGARLHLKRHRHTPDVSLKPIAKPCLHAWAKCSHHSDSCDMTLFIATQKDITAYNIGNPKGPILWSRYMDASSNFCAINMGVGIALHGDTIVDMRTGQVVVRTLVNEAVCGCVMNDHVAIIGCKNRLVVFYDYVKKEPLGEVMFGEDEEIRSITSGWHNSVAVAGSDTIRLFNVTCGSPAVECVRTLFAGSKALRQEQELPMVSSVFFDGERCITDNYSATNHFVRVYDFYLPSK